MALGAVGRVDVGYNRACGVAAGSVSRYKGEMIQTVTTRTAQRITLAACLAGTLAFSLGLAQTRSAGRNPALSTADLLVDLARDCGLNCRGKQTTADVLRVKTRLRAA